MTVLFRLRLLLIFLLLALSNFYKNCAETDVDDIEFVPASEAEQQETSLTDAGQFFHNPVISAIYIEGNHITSQGAILAKVPFRVGDYFKKNKTGKIIRDIHSLGFFQKVRVEIEFLPDNTIALYIVVEEKKKLSRFNFTGNNHLKADEINKKLKLTDIQTIDEEDLPNIIEQIKKLYREKDYHNAVIEAQLVPDQDSSVSADLSIKEGCKSLVKRIFFTGNTSIPSKKLRTLLFTREDWIFGFFDKSGSYQPEAVEYDRHVIEHYYQSNGFLTAHVTDVKVDENPKSHDLSITFNIDEGPIYTISEVNAPGNDVLCEQDILMRIPIRPGDLYSKERIRQTMENLRLVWGEYGYIYADIHPSVRPDQATRTVALTFNSDLGNKITVNRINFMGNRKTRDKVIRRELAFAEGEQLTTFKMDQSKLNVERLGYFDQRNGVNWKISRIDEEHADLDLILKEIKTGNMYAQVGFGGVDDIQSPSTGAKISAGLRDSNFWGTGITYNINTLYSNQDRMIAINISDPWLFDKPINGSLDVYHRRSNYDEFINVFPTPTEELTGVQGSLGFTARHLNFTRFVFDGGLERICYPVRPRVSASVPLHLQANFQATLDDRFIPGKLAWVDMVVGQDQRNHPTFPTRGYQWVFNPKVGIPHTTGDFGFLKLDLDYRWYTPLIEEYSLVFYLHSHLGFVHAFRGHAIPYRELYNIGGLATVRGFLFGQIGPSLLVRQCDEFHLDPIGAQKAFWINLELQFPITADMSMRGVLFYDGGAGWDTPNAGCISRELLRNNQFNYRHAIGFGVRLTYPTPVRIDWGFKLDRNKRLGEKASEIHFTAMHDF